MTYTLKKPDCIKQFKKVQFFFTWLPVICLYKCIFFFHTEVKEWTQNRQGNFPKKNLTKRALSSAQYSYELKGENQRWKRIKKRILDSADMRYLIIKPTIDALRAQIKFALSHLFLYVYIIDTTSHPCFITKNLCSCERFRELLFAES